MYKVGSIGSVPDGTVDPVGGHSVGGLHLYELAHLDVLADYEAKLFIDWGKGFRTWVQNAASNEKQILEFQRHTEAPRFPGFREFVWNIKDIELIPETWKEVLRSVKGVYALTCMETGKIYVGSAKGCESLYGRFLDYAADGHGGSVQLKKRKKRDYQVTVLEVRSSDHEIEAVENVWMDKLLTRRFGLNGVGYPPSLNKLAHYAEVFASPEFKVGEWAQLPPVNGVAHWPSFRHGNEVEAFTRDAYDQKWVLEDFPWTEWKQSEECRGLIENPDQLLSASPDQLFRLITTILRQDRFAEGSLAEAFESGLMLRIVQRARDIVGGKG